MTDTIRFLHIEDDPLDAEMVEAELRKEWPDCEYSLVSSEAELAGRLAAERFDVILADYSLTGYDGMSAMSLVKERSPDTPFLFVTGTMGEERAIETLKSGATDYILKMNLSKLLPAINRALHESRAETERLEMAEQISHATREWQNTFDAISDSISLIDPDQRIIRCNRSTSMVLGLDYPDIINQPCWKLFHGADGPIPECPMTKAVLSHNSEVATIKIGDIWLEVTVDPIFSGTGVLTSAVHIVRDVTERVNLTNSIRDTSDLFRQFMKYSPIYTFIKEVSDAESLVLEASDNYWDLIGVRSKDMIGKNMHQIFPKEFADIITADDQMVVATKQVHRFEEHLNDGTYISYKFPLERSDGKTLLAGYTIDITDRKRADESLREMQSQLMQQDKLATIGQLAAGVAHEINNPIGFVSSNMATLVKYIEKYNRYIELLEDSIKAESDGLLPDQLQEARKAMKLDYVTRDIGVLLEESNEGIERVKRIVQDLKLFSRADSSTIGPANLNDCLDSTINIIINEVKYVAELKKEYAHLPKVRCNIQQVNQVFMNMLTNAAHAIEAKGEGVGEITVCTWCDNDNVFISLSDTGCGIPPENMNKIFDAFFTTKEIGKGTGLGLSISRGIINKHGGEIMVKSEVGVGSTFTVRLPLKPPE